MQSVAEIGINLFGETLPSMEDIGKLKSLVRSSERTVIEFGQQVESNMSKTSASACLATGIGLWILGKNNEGITKFAKASDCKEKYIYMAFAQRQAGKFDDAIASLQKSLSYDADKIYVAMEKAATYRHACNYEAAAKELKACANQEKVNGEYHYQLGRLQDAQGLYEQAMDNYKTAIELSTSHARALFHLAYRCDLGGDEDAAIEYYKQIAANSPVYTNALLNLAVIYEDHEQFDKAAKCVEKVLEFHPNLQRAQMFRKDIESSKSMYFDEEKEKKKDRKTQILETQISDFELSVRSRNCLKKMNIRTIGDLLNISETELLSYKNFGETSLKEIKIILDSKGLRLGMNVEDTLPPIDEEGDFGDFEDEQEAIQEDTGILSKPVDDLQLSIRARSCLQTLNIRTIGELTDKTEAELLGCKNFGQTSLTEIKKALENLGLSMKTLD